MVDRTPRSGTHPTPEPSGARLAQLSALRPADPHSYAAQSPENLARGAEVLARLLQIDPDRAARMAKVSEGFFVARDYIEFRIRQLLDGARSAQAGVRDIREAADELQRLYKETHASDLAPDILRLAEYTQEQLEPIIAEGVDLSRQASAGEGRTFTYTLGRFVVLELWSTAGLMKAADREGFAHLIKLAENCAALARFGDAGIVRHYVSDLVFTSLAIVSQDDQQFNHLLGGGFQTERCAQLATRSFMRATIPQCANLFEIYRKIGAEKLGGLLPQDMLSRIRLLPVLAEWGETLARANIGARDRVLLTELMVAAGEAESFQTLNIILERPALLNLTRGLRHQGISPKQFVALIINSPYLSREDEGGNKYIDRLVDLGRNPALITPVAALLVHQDMLVEKCKIDQALFVATAPYADQLTPAYCEFVGQGEPAKAEICLAFSRDSSLVRDPAHLKSLLRTVRARSEKECQAALDRAEALHPFKVLSAMRAESSAAPEKAAAKTDWRHQLTLNISDQGNQELALLVESAFRRSDMLIDARLRNIWLSVPAALEPFCRHVRHFAANGLFRFVLSSSSLFERYKAALVSDQHDLTALFGAYGSSSPPTKFPADLDTALPDLGELAEPTLSPDAGRTPTLPEHQVKYDVSRLIISGGNITQARQARIREALKTSHPDLEVTFLGDTFAPSRYQGQIDERTWVLHLPHCSNHGLRSTLAIQVAACVERVRRHGEPADTSDTALRTGPIFQVMPSRATGTNIIVEHVRRHLP